MVGDGVGDHTPAAHERIQALFVTGGQGGPCGAAADPVQACIHHDAVQPGGNRRVAAE